MNPEKSTMYHGVIVPMVSPFDSEGKIDRTAASKMIQYLLDNGTTPFVLGTSGEVYSIAIQERDVLVRILVKHRRAGVPLIVGMGGLTFEDTIRLGNQYFDWGIDALVLTLPGYFMLSDQQIYHYFSELAGKLNGDIILYNIPATIHMSLPIGIVDKLSKIENIIGIKDSEYDEKRLEHALSTWKARADFLYLVGVNEMMKLGLSSGASGIVPSTANLFPDLYRDMFSMHRQGNYSEVEKIQQRTAEILSLYKDGHLLGESIAILKYLVSLKGLISPDVLPPLTALTEKDKKVLKSEWEKWTSGFNRQDGRRT